MQRQAFGAPEPGFHTTAEWSEKINRSLPQTQRLLRTAVAAGEAEMRVYKVQTGASKRPVPHYRITELSQSERSSAGKAS